MVSQGILQIVIGASIVNCGLARYPASSYSSLRNLQ